MINILIPAAGRGKRFRDVGYKQSKPLIPVGKTEMPMICLVIHNLSQFDHDSSKYNFIILCQKDDLENIRHECLKWFGHTKKKFTYIPVNGITEGSACTCLLAKDLINNDQELIIANSDQLVGDSFEQRYIDFYRYNKADGGILCFLNDSPKWSYVRIKDDHITQVVEKQVISNIATVGIYYFKHGKYFVESAERMIEKNDRVSGEFYTAPTYNYMILDGLKVIPYMINNMYGIGTPQDLKLYEEICKSLI